MKQILPYITYLPVLTICSDKFLSCMSMLCMQSVIVLWQIRLSSCPSVCLYVSVTLRLCINEYTYWQTLSTTW